MGLDGPASALASLPDILASYEVLLRANGLDGGIVMGNKRSEMDGREPAVTRASDA